MPDASAASTERVFLAGRSAPYADAPLATERAEGLTRFLNTASGDLDGETDVEERGAQLTGYGGVCFPSTAEVRPPPRRWL